MVRYTNRNMSPREGLEIKMAVEDDILWCNWKGLEIRHENNVSKYDLH